MLTKECLNFAFSSAKTSNSAKILNYDFNVLKGHWYLSYPLLLWLKFKAQHVLNRLSEEVEHPGCSAASCSWKILFCYTILIIPLAATTSRSNRQLMNKKIELKKGIFCEKIFGCLHWELWISMIDTDRNDASVFHWLFTPCLLTLVQ